jgi:hypothetical protein
MKLPITSHHRVLQISTETLKPFNGLTSAEFPADLPDTVLLSPLLVLESPDDASTYIIIDGYKRFLSWIERKVPTVTCVVIPAVSLTDAGKMRIELNCNRPVPFSEKLQSLKWVKSNCTETDYLEIARTLSVSGKELRDIELLFDAPAQLVNAVTRGVLDSTLVAELQFFSMRIFQQSCRYSLVFLLRGKPSVSCLSGSLSWSTGTKSRFQSFSNLNVLKK